MAIGADPPPKGIINRRLNRRTAVIGMLAATLPVAAPRGLRAEPIYQPARRDDGWSVVAPSDAGISAEALAELSDMVDAGVTVPNVHALLIERGGSLVFERYKPGQASPWAEMPGLVDHGPETLHDLRSVTKSVTSLLLGIALQGDLEALDRPLPEFFPDRDSFGDGFDQVTLHHALTMTAGLAWNEVILPPSSPRNDYTRLLTTEDPVGYVLSKPVTEAPGTRWVYNSGLTEVIAAVIERLTETPLEHFAEAALFAPLGIRDVEWMRPDAWDERHTPIASAGLRLTARDLTRIGLMVRRGGQWQDRQIVPATWLALSTTRHVQTTPWGPAGAYGYGYQWFPGQHLSGERVLRAVGYGDQRLYVLPDLDLCLTIFAGNYNAGSTGLGERILGRVIRAIV